MAIWHHNMRAHLRQYWYRFLYKIPSYRHLKSRRALERRQNVRPKDRMPRTHHQNLSNVTIDTSLNAHCKLLNKLPLEIRQQIYTEVLKDDAYGHCSRIVTEKCRLTSVPGCECDQYRPVQRLALLKTCRQVYTEAIDLFYSSWVFHIDDLDTLISLTRTIVPHRLAKIKLLQLCFENCWPSSIKGDLISGPTSEEIWSTVVNKLTGLKELDLSIYQHTHVELPYGTVESERKTLEPLLILRGLEDFDLHYVHGHQHHDDNGVDTSPEAVAFREYVKGVVCTPKGQEPAEMKLADIVRVRSDENAEEDAQKGDTRENDVQKGDAQEEDAKKGDATNSK